MLNALERLHVGVHSILEFVRPAQAARHFGHVLVQRHATRRLALLNHVTSMYMKDIWRDIQNCTFIKCDIILSKLVARFNYVVLSD